MDKNPVKEFKDFICVFSVKVVNLHSEFRMYHLMFKRLNIELLTRDLSGL